MRSLILLTVAFVAVQAKIWPHELVRVESEWSQYPQAKCHNGHYPAQCMFNTNNGKLKGNDIISNGQACFAVRKCKQGCSVVAFCCDTSHLGIMAENNANAVRKGYVLKVRNPLRTHNPYAVCPPGFEVKKCKLSSGYKSKKGGVAVHGRTCYTTKPCDSKDGCFIKVRCRASKAIQRRKRHPELVVHTDFEQLRQIDPETRQAFQERITEEMVQLRTTLASQKGKEKERTYARMHALHRLHCELRDGAYVGPN